MKQSKRLWRVETTHIRGYTAPTNFTETEGGRFGEAEIAALKKAKANSILSKFPQWTNHSFSRTMC